MGVVPAVGELRGEGLAPRGNSPSLPDGSADDPARGLALENGERVLDRVLVQPPSPGHTYSTDTASSNRLSPTPYDERTPSVSLDGTGLLGADMDGSYG